MESTQCVSCVLRASRRYVDVVSSDEEIPSISIHRPSIVKDPTLNSASIARMEFMKSLKLSSEQIVSLLNLFKVASMNLEHIYKYTRVHSFVTFYSSVYELGAHLYRGSFLCYILV